LIHTVVTASECTDPIDLRDYMDAFVSLKSTSVDNRRPAWRVSCFPGIACGVIGKFYMFLFVVNDDDDNDDYMHT